MLPPRHMTPQCCSTKQPIGQEVHLCFSFGTIYSISHFASRNTWPCVQHIHTLCHLHAAQAPRLMLKMRKENMCGYIDGNISLFWVVYRLTWELYVCLYILDIRDNFYKEHRHICPTSGHKLIQHNGSLFISHLCKRASFVCRGTR